MRVNSKDAPFGLTQVAINARHRVNDAAGPKSKSSKTYGFKSASLKSQTVPFISNENGCKRKTHLMPDESCGQLVPTPVSQHCKNHQQQTSCDRNSRLLFAGSTTDLFEHASPANRCPFHPMSQLNHDPAKQR